MGDTYARVYVRVSRMTRSCIQDGRRAWKAPSTVAKGGESPEVKLPECSYLLNTLFNYSCVNVAFLPLPSICLRLIAGRPAISAKQRRASFDHQDGSNFLAVFLSRNRNFPRNCNKRCAVF